MTITNVPLQKPDMCILICAQIMCTPAQTDAGLYNKYFIKL